MSKSREQVNDWLKNIDVTGKTVLDVGAGRPRAWLFPPEEEGRPKVKGAPKEYKTADINPEWGCDYIFDLNVDNLCLPHDYVFCLETLEHIYDPVQAIKNLAAFTKEKLFISAPFINPIHDTHDFLRYTSQWFEIVLPNCGFKDVVVTPRVATDKEGLHKFYVTEGMRMSKISRKLGYSKNYYDIGYICEATK